MFAPRTCARPWLLRTFVQPLQRRALQSTPLVQAYPKEGVFQPNSPPREYPQYEQQPQPQSTRLPRQSRSFQPPPPPPQPPKQRFRVRLGRYLGLLILSSIGYVSAQLVAPYLLPVMPAIPGSEDDVEELSMLAEELDALPLVQELREQMHEVDGVLQPVWREWVAYSGMKDRRSSRLTTGPLAGSAGLAAQVVFWNESKKELLLFVAFGDGTTGWPMTVHGGAIATVCDEALGRVAIRSTEKHSAVTASLEISYIDKCNPGLWHVLHAGQDRTKPSTNSKKYVRGYLTCVGDYGPKLQDLSLHIDPKITHVHAIAKGLFVVPSSYPLRPLEEGF